MSKEIKDYLHLYLGCECIYSEKLDMAAKAREHEPSLEKYVLDNFKDGKIKTFDADLLSLVNPEHIKLLLRPLSDITEDEKAYVGFSAMVHNEIIWTPEKLRYLLSKHFDLFGLHEAGLCIYKSDLNRITYEQTRRYRIR